MNLVSFFISVFVMPLGFAVWLVKFFPYNRTNFWLYLGSLWFAGQICGALFLYWLLMFFPGKTDHFYLLGLFLFLILLNLRNGKVFLLAMNSLFDGGRNLFKIPFLKTLAIFLLLAKLISVFYFAVDLPLQGNDTFQYAKISQIFYQTKSLAGYPFIDGTQNNGFFLITSHPPMYEMLMLVNHLLEGTSAAFGISRFIAPLALASTAILFFLIISEFWIAFAASLFYLYSPLVIENILMFQIDGLRVYAAVLLFFTFYLLEREKRFHFVPIFFASTFLFFSHSIGIRDVLIVSLSYLLFRFQRFENTFKLAIWIFFASLVGGMQYYLNFAQRGYFISDRGVVWQLPGIKYELFLLSSRNLVGWGERIWLGALMPLSRVDYFGWLPLLSLVLVLWLRDLKNVLSRFLLILITVSILFSLVLILLGKNEISNFRYQLELQPLFSMLFAVLLFQALEKYSWRNGVFALVVAIIVVPGLTYFAKFERFRLEDFQTEVFGHAEQLSLANKKYSHQFYDDFSYATDDSTRDLLSFVNSRIGTGQILVFQLNKIPYFTKANVVSDSDSRLIDFYESPTLEAAEEALKKLDVQYIYFDNYPASTFFNSFAAQIIADPRRARMIFSQGGHTIYSLHSDIQVKFLESLNLYTSDLQSDLATFANLKLASSEYELNGLLKASGAIRSKNETCLVPAGNYVGQLLFEGSGLIKIFLTFSDGLGSRLATVDQVFTKKETKFQFSSVGPVCLTQIYFELSKDTHAKISRLELIPFAFSN